MPIGADLAGSITGCIESACLIVYDCRDMQNAVNNTAGAMPNTPQGAQAAAKLRGATADILNNTDAVRSLGGTQAQKKFNVQFNPNQLTLYSRAPSTKKTDLCNPARSAPDAFTPPTVELSLTLYFDHVNLQDAFMWDKFTAGASVATVGNLTSGIASAAGKVWSVQPEVEGLISALRNPFTRTVAFQWAKFSFVGILRNIDAKYTMFSTSGRPIRAEVSLRLRQDRSVSGLAAWNSDFEKLFGENGTLGKSAASAAQSAGNLLNLTL